MNNFWLRKGDRPNLVLAPMAGYTDSAFRLMCKQFGADIVMTEMVSADAIYHNRNLKPQTSNLKIRKKDLLDKDRTLSLLKFSEKERPIVVQLFGKHPEKFAFAAKWVAGNLKPDGIDINMGCPARKVISSDHGAALLKNPSLAVEIVQAVRENISIPLSVKTRLGWESDDEILKIAPELIKAGINAIIIHGRTYKDGFKYSARWKNIYKTNKLINYSLKSSCAVVGNGDIKSYGEAIEKSESGGIKLDGVAIGRSAFGNPLIFSDKLKTKSYKLKAIILRHAKLCYKTKGEHGIIEFRKHLLAYLKGQPNAKELRQKAVQIKSIKDIKMIINQIS